MPDFHLHLLFGGTITVTDDGNHTAQFHPRENPKLLESLIPFNHVSIDDVHFAEGSRDDGRIVQLERRSPRNVQSRS